MSLRGGSRGSAWRPILRGMRLYIYAADDDIYLRVTFVRIIYLRTCYVRNMYVYLYIYARISHMYH